MKIGVVLLNYGSMVTYDSLRRSAVLAEKLSYDSIWTTDHILVPQQNVDPYGTIYEPLMTLAMLGEATSRVQLGTSVIVLPMRNPVVAGKQAATLDAATNGRVILGVGVGWNEQEYKNLGADFNNRGKRLDEDIELLRSLWAKEQVTFQGKYTQIADGYSSPLPPQKTIPIWIGGNGEPSIRRAARLGDGWHPNGAPPEEIAQGARRIREMGTTRPITISARFSIDLRPDTPPTFQYRGNLRYRITGTLDAIRARVREYRQAGVEHMVLLFPLEDISLGLEQMEQFARDVMPEFK